jgi:hypothetical protein
MDFASTDSKEDYWDPTEIERVLREVRHAEFIVNFDAEISI